MNKFGLAISMFLSFSSLAVYCQRPAEPLMVHVEGGTFNMGSNRNEDEKPIHKVTVSSFKMAKYEVTVAEYKIYCNSTGRQMPIVTPPWGWIDSHPMTIVSWSDASAYCDWLSDKTGKLYRLPTEAEWEYAARGGNKSKNTLYSGSNVLNEVAWYDIHGTGTRPVGQKQANELGLFDMSGNVLEWCSDWYGKYSATTAASVNPRGPQQGYARVMRGGSWLIPDRYATVSFRYNLSPSLPHRINGFRVVSPE